MKNNVIHRICLCDIRESNDSLLSKMNVHSILHYLYLTFYPAYDILVSSKEGNLETRKETAMKFNVEKFVEAALELKFKSIDVITAMTEFGYWYTIYEDDTMGENEYWLDFEDESGDMVFYHFIDDIIVDWEF